MGDPALVLQLGGRHRRCLQVSMLRVGLPLVSLTVFEPLLTHIRLLSRRTDKPGWSVPLPLLNCRTYAKLLAAAFEKRADLQVTICHALRRLCTQNRVVLVAAGEPVGFADPYGSGEEEEPASQEEQAHLDIPDSFTPEMARQ